MPKDKPFMKGKYTASKDKKMDAHLLRKAGINEKDDKAKFEKMDTAHGKKKRPKTIAEDKKIDTKIISKIKKHERAEEKAEKKEKTQLKKG